MKKLYLKPVVKVHQTRVKNVILSVSGGEPTKMNWKDEQTDAAETGIWK